MLTAFFWRQSPASTMAKPAFMKITRAAQISTNMLLARKAGVSSGSWAAWAERLNRPRPSSAIGMQVSQVSVRLEDRPRILLSRSRGASERLACWRLRAAGLFGWGRATVMRDWIVMGQPRAAYRSIVKHLAVCVGSGNYEIRRLRNSSGPGAPGGLGQDCGSEVGISAWGLALRRWTGLRSRRGPEALLCDGR